MSDRPRPAALSGREPARVSRTADFLVGEWAARPRLNRLEHRGTGLARRLEPRVMDLLCHLAAGAGQVLSRESLTAALWPRVIVGENSLTRAVSDLRRALRVPGAPDGALIETIPKRGYRLTAAVRPLPRGFRPGRREPAASGRLGRPFGRRSAPGVAAGACLALALALWLDAGAPPELRSAAPGDEVVGLALPPGADAVLASERPPAEAAPVFSADGRLFAFVRHAAGASTIHLGATDGAREPVAIYSHPGRVANLTWSPVGDALLFAGFPELNEAFLDPGRSDAVLYSLDLDTRTVSALTESEPERSPPRPNRV